MDPYQKTVLFFMLGLIVLIIIIVFLINSLRLSKKDTAKYRSNYPSRYLCNDGHIVRSLSECVLDNYFHRNGISHKYEDIIVKSMNSADKQYKYDWYFPDVDLYIEFFGFSGKKYKKNTEDKKKFYRKHHLKMISIEPSDLDKITEKIPLKFGKIWSKITQPRHCPNCGGELDDRV
ncbi:MAG: hypothetical protein ACTSVU_03940 [Promethearchaeota archaeon]